jgi:hypothetical protein
VLPAAPLSPTASNRAPIINDSVDEEWLDSLGGNVAVERKRERERGREREGELCDYCVGAFVLYVKLEFVKMWRLVLLPAVAVL